MRQVLVEGHQVMGVEGEPVVVIDDKETPAADALDLGGEKVTLRARYKFLTLR